MQLRCQAIPANTHGDDTQSPRCPELAIVPSSFCREHVEEFHALEEGERTAAHDSARLKPLVDEMLAEGAEGYTHMREIAKDERVARLYAESLEEQIGAAVALRTRFSSEAEDRGSESLAVLEERKAIVEAFLAALQARAGVLERELERQQERVAASPAQNEPPLYPILEVPHPPYACTANLTDNCADRQPRVPPGQCTALENRDGARCRLPCRPGLQFCFWHGFMHGTAVDSSEDTRLEALRQRILHDNGEKKRAGRISGVKEYIQQLEKTSTAVEEHQQLFRCRASKPHSALLEDLKMRRISAILLLAELSGRTNAEIAEQQGQTETWANEYFAEVKQKDAEEIRNAEADLLTGAIVSGVSIWLGVPWARSLIAGAVTSLVVSAARDASQKS